jgi:hypothetical protein
MRAVLHRIRWSNLARVGAVAAAVALLVAWPHLRSDAPMLPPAAPALAAPVLADTEASVNPAPDAERRPAAAKRRTPVVRPKRNRRRPHRRRRVRHRSRREPSGVTPPVAGVPAAPSFAPAPPAAEFKP